MLLASEDLAVRAAVRRLAAGQIVAIKGLGGFHLACDARNTGAVAELRRRKQREEKPFAVMGLNVASLAGHARIAAAERALLEGVAAPIVLCPKTGGELPGVAPGLAWLGVFIAAALVVMLVAGVVGSADFAAAAMVPLMLLLASMFFTSMYFTVRDCFVTDETETPGNL